MLGRDVTSNASNPSASSIAASAACRSARLSRLEVPGKRFESQPIAVGAESRHHAHREIREQRPPPLRLAGKDVDRKSTRLNSSHVSISYAVFCLKKKKKNNTT